MRKITLLFAIIIIASCKKENKEEIKKEETIYQDEALMGTWKEDSSIYMGNHSAYVDTVCHQKDGQYQYYINIYDKNEYKENNCTQYSEINFTGGKWNTNKNSDSLFVYIAKMSVSPKNKKYNFIGRELKIQEIVFDSLFISYYHKLY